MKIFNIFLLTCLFFSIYGYLHVGVYFTWELAFFIIMIWDYKLNGWDDEWLK